MKDVDSRLAMMRIIYMIFQDGLTGSMRGDWELYTSTPLLAFENDGPGDFVDLAEFWSGDGDSHQASPHRGAEARPHRPVGKHGP